MFQHISEEDMNIYKKNKNILKNKLRKLKLILGMGIL
jgi:hypothetical protein